MMNFEELQNHLEPENIGSAPLSVRLGVILTLCVIIIGAGLWFDTQNQLTQLDTVERSEFELKTEFTIKADKAAGLAQRTCTM